MTRIFIMTLSWLVLLLKIHRVNIFHPCKQHVNDNISRIQVIEHHLVEMILISLLLLIFLEIHSHQKRIIQSNILLR